MHVYRYWFCFFSDGGTTNATKKDECMIYLVYHHRGLRNKFARVFLFETDAPTPSRSVSCHYPESAYYPTRGKTARRPLIHLLTPLQHPICVLRAPFPLPPNKRYDEKTDVYSLGMLLFEMCHPPFGTKMERTVVLTKAHRLQFPKGDVWGPPKGQDAMKNMCKSMLQEQSGKRPSAADIVRQVHICNYY